MKVKLVIPLLLLLDAGPGRADGQDQIVESPQRWSRQIASVDSCVLGCITSSVTQVGLTNVRPSSWSWKLTDLLQSTLLRSFCQAFDHAQNCISSCSFSPSKLLITGLMGVPSIFCAGSPGAKSCIKDVSKAMQNTCNNQCGDMKPSFGLRTWLSYTRMTNIFNDMCAYWGCQIACEKPAVERQCNQEAKSLMNRISGVGMDTLKNALKSAGLSSVCGGNATRIPNTYEVVTEHPDDYDQQGQTDGDQDQTGGDQGGDWGQTDGNQGPSDGYPEGGTEDETETSVRVQEVTGTAGISTTTPRGRKKGSRRRGKKKGSRRMTTTLAPEDGGHLGDEDYWQAVRNQGGRG